MTEDKPWLSLPDEEPPERGLAELMAAARVQADAMSRHAEAPAPWWKRMFEVLRRPPVLALATILVLFGGVIVVGRHPDQVQAPAPEAIPAVAPVVQPPPPSATPPGEAMAVPQAVAPADPPKHVEKKPTAVTSRPIEKAAPEETAHERAAIEQTITDRKAAASGGAVQLAAPEPATAVHDDDESPAPTGVVGAPGPKGAATGEGTVASPMPGRVLKVLVAEGDEVEAGAAVVVVEAMKMENELCTQRAGAVKKVHVAPGQAVESGAKLVEIG